MKHKGICKNCGHIIQWYPTYQGQSKIGKWLHTDGDGWFSMKCRSCGKDCDCEIPKLRQNTQGGK